jgi:hypothetical protein
VNGTPAVHSSPLGRFSDIVAALTALALVTAAILAHTGVVPVSDTAWLDTSAGLAIGVILGQRATTNGAAKLAVAAHDRLDKISAPPAAEPVPDRVGP